jgi:hypothetical protein
MNFTTYIKKLFRATVADPKLLLLIGVAFAVGVYFWNPLARHPGEQAAAKPKEAMAGMAVWPISPQPTPSSEPERHRPTWRETIEWMRKDPRAQSAVCSGTRDPFEIVDDNLRTTRANGK